MWMYNESSINDAPEYQRVEFCSENDATQEIQSNSLRFSVHF